jgi:CRISPR-associated protein Cmr1
MNMRKLEYEVRFLTPAFLGNAQQAAQWRTPPFKALLRQWWRVAYAAERKFNIEIDVMRREEGVLFGNAWLSHKEGKKTVSDYCKSQVRIRLTNAQNDSAWVLGTQTGVAPLSRGLDTSYAWFGLIKPDRSAIKAGTAESIQRLILAAPDKQIERLQEVVSLVHSFGLLGSRSRGGWGALHVEPADKMHAKDIHRYTRDITMCLKDDWAMSLAKDERGLCVWETTQAFRSWDKAMHFIATERKRVRTALKIGADLRSALGFASLGRMPSPLRWKVVMTDTKELAVRIFPLPHRIPDEGGKKLTEEQLVKAWKTVSSTLDAAYNLKRVE